MELSPSNLPPSNTEGTLSTRSNVTETSPLQSYFSIFAKYSWKFFKHHGNT